MKTLMVEMKLLNWEKFSALRKPKMEVIVEISVRRIRILSEVSKPSTTRLQLLLQVGKDLTGTLIDVIHRVIWQELV